MKSSTSPSLILSKATTSTVSTDTLYSKAKMLCTSSNSPKRISRSNARYAEAKIEALLRKSRLEDGCWVYEGTITKFGYGRMTYQGVLMHVHRWAYEQLVCPIPDGLVPDHTCENKACFNPRHLELVTVRENLLRSPNTKAAQNAAKTHCLRGHELAGWNLVERVQRGNGPQRVCRTCSIIHKRAWKLGITADEYIAKYDTTTITITRS